MLTFHCLTLTLTLMSIANIELDLGTYKSLKRSQGPFHYDFLFFFLTEKWREMFSEINCEIFPAGGEKWHTGCFKCNMCNKMLDSTNNNAKDNVLYCKVRRIEELELQNVIETLIF